MDFNLKFLLEIDYKYLRFHFVALYHNYKIKKNEHRSKVMKSGFNSFDTSFII
jgi:hypothetical protein